VINDSLIIDHFLFCQETDKLIFGKSQVYINEM